MAHMILTNVSNWREKLKELYSYAGFSKNADGCAAENVWFQTYKKLKINNENAYHNDEGFVICCGKIVMDNMRWHCVMDTRFMSL